MNFYLLLSILSLSIALYVWVGQRAAKGIKNSDDYYLMGKELTFFPLMMTLLATQLGAGTLTGVCDLAFMHGWVALIYPLGMVVGFVLLGLGIGERLHRMNIKTVPEIFEAVYASKLLRYGASVFSMITFFFILVAQGISIQELFISIGLEHPLYFFIFWSILVFYTVMGGLKAVVDTDVLQAMFIVLGLFVTFSVTLFAFKNEWLLLKESAPLAIDQVVTQWFLMPLLFVLMGQDMGQRFFAAKDKKEIALASFGSAFLLFFCSFIGVYFGVMAANHGILVPKEGSTFMAAIDAFTPSFVATFSFVALLMAVVSTADSLLFSLSSNLFCDFLEKIPMGPQKKIGLAKMTTFLIGMVVFMMTFIFKDVVPTLIFAYGLSVCSFSLPILFAFWLKKPRKLAAYLSVLAGGGTFFLLYFSNHPPYTELKALLASLFAYLLGHAFAASKG